MSGRIRRSRKQDSYDDFRSAPNTWGLGNSEREPAVSSKRWYAGRRRGPILALRLLLATVAVIISIVLHAGDWSKHSTHSSTNGNAETPTVMKVGDCFLGGNAADGTNLLTPTAIPCTSPHTSQFYAENPGGQYTSCDTSVINTSGLPDGTNYTASGIETADGLVIACIVNTPPITYSVMK